MPPRSPRDLKNYFYNDCLKDWFVRYQPRPPIEKSCRIKPKVSLEVLSTHLSQAPSFLEFNLALENHLFKGVIPCAIDRATLLRVFPRFCSTNARGTNVIPSHYIIVPGAPRGGSSWLQNRQRRAYHSAEKLIYRDLLSFHLNLPLVDVGMLEYFVDTHDVIEDFVNTDEVGDMIEKALGWLNLVEAEGPKWSLDAPPHVKMMPNLGLPFPDEYSEDREKLAWKWKDVGLLYWVGPATRTDMHHKNIFTLNHPGVSSYLLTNKMHAVQQSMLQTMFLPVVPTSVRWASTDTYYPFVYLDIETTTQADETVCNIVGFLYKTPLGYEYKHFVSKDSSSIASSTEWLLANFPERTIVHYTAADKPAVPTQMATLDLYDTVRKDYMSSDSLKALHLNNFKLKVLYKKLCERMQLPNLYDGCRVKNGLEAMYALERYVDLDERTKLDDVIKYNRVDCLALALLHQYLLGEFDEAAKVLLEQL